MNTNKNSYVIIYAAVMVILAAVLLAGANILLKPAQEENASIDKMEQILRALGKTAPKAEVISTYKELIKQELLVNAEGQVVKTFEGDQVGSSEAFNANTELDYKLIAKGEKRDLPVFVAEVDGKKLYVFPLNGAGLWNKIWGYLAVDATDRSTIEGADFGNAGETPGLGAEISTPRFANQFKGKQLFREGTFTGIAVVKAGQKSDTQDYVDGISGGTLTSNGVHDMLHHSLAPFQKFLETSNAQ
jgi:NADH:ubiquinone oxidoreductase, Na(+)-translocating, C subunit